MEEGELKVRKKDGFNNKKVFEDGWTSGGRKFALWRQEMRAANSEGQTEGQNVNLRENKCVAKKNRYDININFTCYF